MEDREVWRLKSRAAAPSTLTKKREIKKEEILSKREARVFVELFL